MNKDVLAKLKSSGLLSEQICDLGFVPTGSYALNKIISGDYNKGIPIGMITQFIGESSTAKTVFATHILREAQALGHYTVLIDSENTFNSDFAETLGLDPARLLYSAPDTLEDCFDTINKTIAEIRELDKDTPIVIAYDSIAVSPSKSEFNADNFDGTNMDGAIRAKIAGACLRKVNSILRKQKVALIIINQIRNKVGVMYGDPSTPAGGGMALAFYLGVNLKCVSNKTSDLIKCEETKNVLGIRGSVKNIKNKVSVPFKECEFELTFHKGLNKYCGLLKLLEVDGIVTRSGAWYEVKGTNKKFQSKDFEELLLVKEANGFEGIRKLLGLSF